MEEVRAFATWVAVAGEFPDRLVEMLRVLESPVIIAPLEDAVNAIAPTALKAAREKLAEISHPFASGLPTVQEPLCIVAGLLFYAALLATALVVSKCVGRRSYAGWVLAHNGFLFGLSLYMSVMLFFTVIASGYTLWDNPVHRGTKPTGPPTPNEWRMAKLVWLFYVSKIPEFLDTVIMILKQNYRQVSFLHLYHHSTIYVIWFVVSARTPGGDAYWSSMLNSGIHVVMYGYYFGTALFEKGPVRKFLEKIKFMITKGQMTQFALNWVQSVYILVLPAPRYPKDLALLLLLYMTSLLLLFWNFLRKNRTPKVKRPSKTA